MNDVRIMHIFDVLSIFLGDVIEKIRDVTFYGFRSFFGCIFGGGCVMCDVFIMISRKRRGPRRSIWQSPCVQIIHRAEVPEELRSRCVRKCVQCEVHNFLGVSTLDPDCKRCDVCHVTQNRRHNVCNQDQTYM